jgi:predicted HicB family RNase H-like nuclease
MSTLSVRVPASLHRNLRELAQREGISMNQLISSAVGEKLAALID